MESGRNSPTHAKETDIAVEVNRVRVYSDRTIRAAESTTACDSSHPPEYGFQIFCVRRAWRRQGSIASHAGSDIFFPRLPGDIGMCAERNRRPTALHRRRSRRRRCRPKVRRGSRGFASARPPCGSPTSRESRRSRRIGRAFRANPAFRVVEAVLMGVASLLSVSPARTAIARRSMTGDDRLRIHAQSSGSISRATTCSTSEPHHIDHRTNLVAIVRQRQRDTARARANRRQNFARQVSCQDTLTATTRALR